MGDVINFNKAQKKLAQKEKERRAKENRRKHGLTKATKKRIDQEISSAQKVLEQKKIDKSDIVQPLPKKDEELTE